MENWTDEQFACWLAGFFDGEGCIYLVPQTNGCEITIANTDLSVMTAIHKRLGMGVLQHVEFDDARWKTKLHWRLRNYEEAEQFLRLVLPFLTIKRRKAEEALQRIEAARQCRDEMLKRNNEIVALAESGKSYKEIGLIYGLSYRTIAAVCQGRIGRSKSAVDQRIWGTRQYKTKRTTKTAPNRSAVKVVAPSTYAEGIHSTKRGKHSENLPEPLT